jgi:hypothetical protein
MWLQNAVLILMQGITPYEKKMEGVCSMDSHTSNIIFATEILQHA